MQTYLAVMLGGALGSALRLGVSRWVATRAGEAFPFGTLAVNVFGCFVIGCFTALTAPGGFFSPPPVIRYFVTVGVLGGFTTFSAFGQQTFDLITRGAIGAAAVNVLVSVSACLLAVWAGALLAGVIRNG